MMIGSFNELFFCFTFVPEKKIGTGIDTKVTKNQACCMLQLHLLIITSRFTHNRQGSSNLSAKEVIVELFN
jgi:hypothetical protein